MDNLFLFKKKNLVHQKIDISSYSLVISYIDSKKKSYVPKQSRTFEREDIDNFLKLAPNETYLIHKLAFLIALNGGLRVEDELTFLEWEDIFESLEKEEIGIKLNKGSKTAAVGDDFLFILVASSVSYKCPISYWKMYKERFPEDKRTGRLFRYNTQNGITDKPIGKTFFSKLPCEVAIFLKKENPQEFTGHCLRRTGATLLADSGVTIVELQRWGRWKNASVAQRYVDKSVKGKLNCAHILNGEQKKEEKQEEEKVKTSITPDMGSLLQGWTVNGNVQIIINSENK